MEFSRTDTGPFALVPEWVLSSEVSHVAKLLYTVLSLYADRNTQECFPSRRTLADRLGVSVSTVDRARRELEGIDALKITARKRDDGGQSSNVYTLMRVRPQSFQTPPLFSNDEGGLVTDEEGKNQSHNEPEQKTSSSGKRDQVWDTLEEFCGTVATKSERSRRGMVAGEIRRAVSGSDEVVAEEIRNRANAFMSQWGARGFTLTDTALARHWTKLGLMAEDGGTMMTSNLCQACEGLGHDGVGGDCRVCAGTGKRRPGGSG